ncbi:MAG: porin family protein [Paludibacter sp.]
MRQILVLFLLCFSSLLFSQIRLEKPEMYVGINLGATESLISFNPSVSQGFLLGYSGGLVFRYNAEKNVGMQAEINYSQRGWTETSGLYTRQLNYIELPFMTHIYMGKKNRFFINIGPKISYLISEKELLNKTLQTEEQHKTLVQNPFDYGLCGGIGLLFNIKGNVYQLDTRANFGLSDIFSNDKRDYFDTSNNLNLSVNFAWLLQIK